EGQAGFSARAGSGRWAYAGALTHANAGSVLAAAAGLPWPTNGEIDLGQLSTIDSAAVAVLLALKRRALSVQAPIKFMHVPAALSALAKVYGVEEILVA